MIIKKEKKSKVYPRFCVNVYIIPDLNFETAVLLETEQEQLSITSR